MFCRKLFLHEVGLVAGPVVNNAMGSETCSRVDENSLNSWPFEVVRVLPVRVSGGSLS